MSTLLRPVTIRASTFGNRDMIIMAASSHEPAEPREPPELCCDLPCHATDVYWRIVATRD